MTKHEALRVEVVYALPDRQVVVTVELQLGATLSDAVNRSGLLRQFPEIDLTRQKTGIFGRLAGADALLKDGDRVEIYRPLTRDPKQARRELAKQGRSMGRQRD